MSAYQSSPYSGTLYPDDVAHKEHRSTELPPLPCNVVVMGVSGCGKTSLASALCSAIGGALLEGDDFHGAHNKALMQAGTALTDADRSSWLATLASELARQPSGLILSCSALKAAYREQLRSKCPGLRFVFLDITPEEALARVKARAAEHFFNPGLVPSQFKALEPPIGEYGVLPLDATLPIPVMCEAVKNWLAHSLPITDQIKVNAS